MKTKRLLLSLLAMATAVSSFALNAGEYAYTRAGRYKVLAADLAEGSGTPGETLDDVLTVACGEGAIRVTRIQRAGKPAMDSADLLRGRPVAAGTRLG